MVTTSTNCGRELGGLADKTPVLVSVGFCDHPGIIPNGLWDSNITSFGSKITLTCVKEFVVNGSATIQCVGLPGRSTYFPVWNTSTPSCREVRNKTNDGEWEDVNISIKPTQSRQNRSNGHRQTTQVLTSFGETTVKSLLREFNAEHNEMNFITFILGTLLGVVFSVLVILSVTWCIYQRKRRGSSQTSLQPTVHPNGGQIQMNPIAISVQEPMTTNHLVLSDSSDTETGGNGRSFPNILGNIAGNSTVHPVSSSHIYQDAEEIDEGLSTFISINRGFPCTAPEESNIDTRVGTSLTSMNIPSDNEYCGLQETSLHKPTSGYDDNEYQDVDLCKLDRMTSGALISTSKVCPFNDSYYNSMAEFPKSYELSTESEYDHINHAFPGDRAGPSHNPGPSSIHATKVYPDRKYNKSCSNEDFVTSTPSEDVFYYKLNPEQQSDIHTNKESQWPNAFDSGDYSLLNPEKDFANEEENFDDYHDTEIQNPESFTSRPQTWEDMYATVNKTVGNISEAEPPPCEELYAQVDKTQGACRVESEPTMQEEIYVNVTDT
ncbi:uncharacterized protein [Diadema setosum]|uniref:uncharacterized protein n=1 Tax=Diadema setosum TaxID=31175 RepID=UPI003B3AB9BC